MHNSAMRVVELFEQIAKSNPKKVLESKETGTHIVLSKNLFNQAASYSIEQKDGKNITITLNKDPNKDSNHHDSYEIEYSDSQEPYSKVETKPGKELIPTPRIKLACQAERFSSATGT
jgi:effector-binding domain-containing protein